MRPVRFQAGLSLIELMIAMALSLLLMLGVLQIFLSSKQSYTANSALTRVQESGRFAMDFISYDLRNAGYKGECLADVDVLIANATDDRFNLNIAMKGWDAQTSLPTWPANLGTDKVPGTDSVIIKHAATSAGALAADVTPTSTAINMTGINPDAEEANLVISSALGCHLFRSGAVTDASIAIDSSNNTGNINRPYTPAITKVLVAQSNQYYVKKGANGTPSLWRKTWNKGATSSASPQELVEGIYDLQLEYGIGKGTGENRAVSNTTFIKANEVSDWNDVVAVKITVLAVGDEKNIASDDQVYDRATGRICKSGDSTCVNSGSVAIPDRRLAQVFTSTVSMRNQLP